MNRMYFVDNGHKKAFTNMVSRYGIRWDKEYSSDSSCYYLLAADEELRRKAARYIEQDSIDWEGIWQQDWSKSYRFVLQLAESFFKKSGSIELVHGLETWGDELFQVAMQAICIRRQGIKGKRHPAKRGFCTQSNNLRVRE